MAETNKVSTNSGVKPPTPNAVPKPAAAGPNTGGAAVPPVQAPPAPFQIRTQRKRTPWLKGLIYADYGTGKTFLCATSSEVPEMNDVIMMNAESGDMSMQGFDVDDIPLNTYRQVNQIYNFLKLHCELRDSKAPDAEQKLIALQARFMGITEDEVKEMGVRRYKTVIIDSLTEVQKYCMYQLLGIQIGKQALDIEPDNPQFAEWGKSLEMISLLVRSFRDLPMHVLFVCSEQTEQDDRKRHFKSPNLPGKLAGAVQGFVDFVGYYLAAPAAEGGAVQRRLYLVKQQTVQAKNRFRGWDGQWIDNPHMRDIFALQNKYNS